MTPAVEPLPVDTRPETEFDRAGFDRPGFDSGRITLAILVQRGKLPLLADYLAQIRASDAMRGLHVTVVHPKSVTLEVDAITDSMPRLRLVQADGVSVRALSLALAQDTGFLHTPYLSVQSLGFERPDEVFAATLAAAEWWAGLGWDRASLETLETTGAPGQHVSLLLPTAFTPRDLTMRYVDQVRVRPGTEGDDWADYLGHLTLRQSVPKLEAVDPRPDGLSLRIALDSRTLHAEPPPHWRYRVVLRNSSGDEVVSEPASPRQRSAKTGSDSWDDLVAFLPLAGTGNGEHELFLELDSPTERLRRRQSLKPRTGALLPSRPVDLPDAVAPHDATGSEVETGDDLPALRYLVLPSADGKRSRVAVQHGRGIGAKVRWTLRMVAKDAAFLVGRRGALRMRWLRLLRLLTLPFFFWRRPWIVGERFDTAQDNGMHLFRHLRAPGNPNRNRAYYVIDPRSPQRGAVADLGNIVDHSSWRHRLYMLHAEVIVGAYSLHYLVPQRWPVDKFIEQLAWRIGSLQVFLQHGVHMSPRAVRRGSTGYDLMVTTTARETEALRAVSGYDRQLAETGMPRYDALKPGPQTRSILFMSTWRQYLVPKLFGAKREAQVPFEGSEYHEFMSQFLAHPRLQAMLARHDYRLLMMPHYNMAEFFSGLPISGDRVALADSADGVSMQDHLRNCDGFMTDYSSVHFDVAYLNTPIIYTRFDEVDYQTRHASPGWFDYDTEGFGPVTRTLEETLDALELMLASGCRQPELYRERVEQAFTHRDHQNSRRVVAAIEDALGQQNEQDERTHAG